jgi:3-deoxy-manno-octulosonate cytidylyltransferase (CMP-KDO synthetase)
MSILGIIPARFASTRFPGKPLADINGRAMILRVYDQAMLSGVFSDVLVATDDRRILDHVTNAGFHAVMTSDSHRSGTDRCLEALELWEKETGNIFNHIINIQGDEPFIHPDQIRNVASLLVSGQAQIASLAKLITNQEDIFSPSVVKVVIDNRLDAIYFSRSPVPYLREVNDSQWLKKKVHYKHIGIYGFRQEALKLACSLPEGMLEKLESLEQLRWIENGLKIRIGLTNEESIAIDTPQDLLKITNTP